MLRSALVTLMIAGLSTVAVADTVYKWLDTSGQVHYTDRPPEMPGARVLGIFERDMIEETVADAQPPSQASDGTSSGFDDGPASRDVVSSVEADMATVRAEQCKQAQGRYKTYIESRRLFRQLPNGEREYLTDEELTQARIEARQAVEDFCN
jgi:hypothetical protein